MKNSITGVQVPLLMVLFCLFLTGCGGEGGPGQAHIFSSSTSGGFNIQWQLFVAGQSYAKGQNAGQGICTKSSYDGSRSMGDCIIDNNVQPGQWLQIAVRDIRPSAGVTNASSFTSMAFGDLEYCRDYRVGSPYQDATAGTDLSYPSPANNNPVPGTGSDDQCWVGLEVNSTGQGVYSNSLNRQPTQSAKVFFIFLNGFIAPDGSEPVDHSITPSYFPSNGNDQDNDGLVDDVDICVSAPAPIEGLPHRDLDLDGLGDECDTDKDGDGTPNFADVCPSNSAFSVFSNGEKQAWASSTGESIDSLCDNVKHRRLQEKIIVGDLDCTSFDTLENTGFWGRARLWVRHRVGSQAGYLALHDWYYKNRSRIDASEGGLKGELDRQYNYLQYLRYQVPGEGSVDASDDRIFEALGFSEREVSDLFKNRIDYGFAPVKRLVYYGHHADVVDRLNDISLLVDADMPLEEATSFVASLYAQKPEIMRIGNDVLGLNNDARSNVPMLKSAFTDVKNKVNGWVQKVESLPGRANKKEKELVIKHLEKVYASYEYDPDTEESVKAQQCKAIVKKLAINSFAVGFVESLGTIIVGGELLALAAAAAEAVGVAEIATLSAAMTTFGAVLTFEFLDHAVVEVANADTNTGLWGNTGTLAGAFFAPLVSKTFEKAHKDGDFIETGESLEYNGESSIALREIHTLRSLKALNDALAEAVEVKIETPALRADVTVENLLSVMKYVSQGKADLEVYKARVESSGFPNSLKQEGNKLIESIEESIESMEENALDELESRCNTCPCQ